jgi:hypothetical protein
MLSITHHSQERPSTGSQTPPVPGKTLLYIFTTTNVVGTVLVVEREEEGQAYPVPRPVYYVSEVLADAKTRYSQPQSCSTHS